MNKVSHESSPLVSGKESIPRIALIGAGGYGATHLGALERLMKGERARLQAVAEPRMDAELQSRLDGLGVTAYSQMSDLLEKEPLDLLAISTPITFHYAMTQEALKKGLYIFLEKPPVPLIHQLEGLIQCDVEKKVLVGFHYVNQLIGRQLKRWMVQGDLGKIKSIRAIFASPRGSIYYQRARWAGKMVLNGEPVFDGPMTNAMSHILNLILFLGGKSEEEFGVPQEVEGEFYRARAIDSYDTACMRGVFPSGTTFGFACSHAVENGSAWKFEITGSKGKAWVEEGKVLNDQNLSFSFQESDFEDPKTLNAILSNK
ncbi:MAG: Gfo/Idh/MocA family oxidoreductase, partial [Verrucomicrobiota bacterium]